MVRVVTAEHSRATLTAAVATLFLGSVALVPVADAGQLKLVIMDHESGEALAARMHLKNARGRPVVRRSRELVVHGDHFVIDGQATLELATGHYTFALDAGPEFKPYTGHFQIDAHANDEKTVEMHRVVDLAREGWWGGDLLAVRPIRHADVLMRAEDLRILPLSVSATYRHRSDAARQPRSEPQQVSHRRVAAVQSVYVEDSGGAIGVHNIGPHGGPLPTAELSSTSAAIAYASEPGGHVDVAFAASWDLPLWLAGGHVDSIQLIDSTALADDVRPLPAGCRSPDPSFFPGKGGQGRWAERIYYHVLSCGLKIPPTAGSGSGLTPSPPGTDRVYVHADPSAPLAYETWWTNLRAGRVFVTNGPLLRASVRGHPPGHVLHLETGQTVELQVGANLATRDRIEYLELIKNGEVEGQVQLDDWARSGGRLPAVTFDESGWLAVRAATNNPNVYQHATTGPFYVESEAGPRISRASVQFFLDWLDALEANDRRAGRLNEDRRAALAVARAFWNELARRAGAP
jgi:hypothetical protein